MRAKAQIGCHALAQIDPGLSGAALTMPAVAMPPRHGRFAEGHLCSGHSVNHVKCRDAHLCAYVPVPCAPSGPNVHSLTCIKVAFRLLLYLWLYDALVILLLGEPVSCLGMSCVVITGTMVA